MLGEGVAAGCCRQRASESFERRWKKGSPLGPQRGDGVSVDPDKAEEEDEQRGDDAADQERAQHGGGTRQERPVRQDRVKERVAQAALPQSPTRSVSSVQHQQQFYTNGQVPQQHARSGSMLAHTLSNACLNVVLSGQILTSAS